MMQKPPICEYRKDISKISNLLMKNVVINGVIVPEDAKKESTSFTTKLKRFFRTKKAEKATWSNRNRISKSTGYASNLRRSRTTSNSGRFLSVLKRRTTSLSLEYETSISGHPSDHSYSSFHNFVRSTQNKE